MNILITGGIGYIGSHTIIELLQENNNIMVIDNLINGNINIKNNIEKISNKKIKFYKSDLINYEELKEIFNKEKYISQHLKLLENQ